MFQLVQKPLPAYPPPLRHRSDRLGRHRDDDVVAGRKCAGDDGHGAREGGVGAEDEREDFDGGEA